MGFGPTGRWDRRGAAEQGLEVRDVMGLFLRPAVDFGLEFGLEFESGQRNGLRFGFGLLAALQP